MILDRRVSSRFKASHVGSYFFALIVKLDHGSGVDDLEFFADQSMGGTVVMPVTGQIDMVVFGKGQLSMVPEFKAFGGQRVKQGFFRSQKLLFPAVALLLHAGLVMGFDPKPDGLIEGMQVKELPVPKPPGVRVL